MNEGLDLPEEAEPPRLRFGVSVNASAAEGADPVADARHAESLGFDIVTLSDHLPGQRPSYETWTLLTWLAAATERVRLGTNVLGLPYRHPAVTAKMAESLHRLSGGRLVLGLGAGGSNQEFAAFGLEQRRPGEKIAALEEAVGLIRALWSEDGFTYRGRHFSTEAATIEPKPEQMIPLWLGTYGPRALGLTGRLAEGWIPSMRFAPLERYREMRDRVRRAAEEADRDPDEIEYAYNVGVRVDERAQKREGVVIGGVDEVVERLVEVARAGVTLINLWPAGDGFDQRERLAKDVVPEVLDAI